MAEKVLEDLLGKESDEFKTFTSIQIERLDEEGFTTKKLLQTAQEDDLRKAGLKTAQIRLLLSTAPPPAAGAVKVTDPPAASPEVHAVLLSDAAIVDKLLQLYAPYFSSHPPSSKRQGPIELQPSEHGEVLESTGLHFKLAAYTPAVDHTIRALMRLARDFKPEQRAAFPTLLQLLRAVGAPGMGKTTFVTEVWGLLRARLQAVEEEEPVLWMDWQQRGAAQLKERLASWNTTAGELVFHLDMSDLGLNVLHRHEEGLSTPVQLAARMLWATIGTRIRYDTLLQQLGEGPQPLLRLLSPFIVMRFIHRAAGLEVGKPSLVVFVWDEVNAVKAAANGQATFVQEHLSAAVACRLDALSAVTDADPRQRLDMMPVLVAASTRGSASSLATTANKKALIRDLRLPLPCTSFDKQLVVMDLLSRLPGSTELAKRLGVTPPSALSGLSEEELAGRCPKHLAKALSWCGSNMRIVELLLGAMTGQQYKNCLRMIPGTLAWVTEEKACPTLPVLLNTLIDVLMTRGWDSWLTRDSRTAFMMGAVAHAQCKMLVNRSTILMHGGSEAADVTVQQLEADGVVELCLPSGQPAPSRRSTCSSDGSGAGENAEHGAAAEAVSMEIGMDVDVPNPDSCPQYRLMITPLLLAAYLRQLRRCEDRSAQLLLASQLLESWRSREFDDLSFLTLTLQLFRDYFKRDVVQLSELFSLMAATKLGGMHVLVPADGFAPSEFGDDVNETKTVQMVQAAGNDSQPWCYVFNGKSGPGDSMMVLKGCDAQGQPTGDLIAVFLQSKLRKQAVSWEAIAGEAGKVPILGEGVQQVFVYVTDQHPSTWQGNKRKRALQQRDTSDDATSAKNISALGQGHSVCDDRGLPIIAVFCDKDWPLRGAASSIKKLIQEYSKRTGEEKQ